MRRSASVSEYFCAGNFPLSLVFASAVFLMSSAYIAVNKVFFKSKLVTSLDLHDSTVRMLCQNSHNLSKSYCLLMLPVSYNKNHLNFPITKIWMNVIHEFLGGSAKLTFCYLIRYLLIWLFIPHLIILLLQVGTAVEEHRRMRNYILRVEREGVQRVKMFLVITAAYVIFWGPLFFVTLVHHPLIGNPLGYEVIFLREICKYWSSIYFIDVFPGSKESCLQYVWIASHTDHKWAFRWKIWTQREVQAAKRLY